MEAFENISLLLEGFVWTEEFGHFHNKFQPKDNQIHIEFLQAVAVLDIGTTKNLKKII